MRLSYFPGKNKSNRFIRDGQSCYMYVLFFVGGGGRALPDFLSFSLVSSVW